MIDTDIVILGAGPAGLAAALQAKKSGVRVLLVEREERAGGILKQCVHDGFGLVRYGEKLAGPEYARRFIDEAETESLPMLLETFVSDARKLDDGAFSLACVNKREGMFEIRSRALILATGCRERTDRQVFIHGDRPAGIYPAGLAQYFVNIQGWLPGKKCVILGSGDIGLIMARRLTLEGMEVEGVYEIKPEPSGLSRNVRQCLHDFGIPLHLSTTVVEVQGKERVESVVVADVDSSMHPIAGTERKIECDTLILSVGLIPENEIASKLGVPLDPSTKGPETDQTGHTRIDGVFSCGNALHVNDLVDYVSESGEIAGASAAAYVLRSSRLPREYVKLEKRGAFLYAVPSLVDPDVKGKTILFFRVAKTISGKTRVALVSDGKVVASRTYSCLRPPEMERLAFDTGLVGKNLVIEMTHPE